MEPVKDVTIKNQEFICSDHYLVTICVRCVRKIEIQRLDFFFSFAATSPTFFSAKKVAKKLESGMRLFSPILRLDPFGDF